MCYRLNMISLHFFLGGDALKGHSVVQHWHLQAALRLISFSSVMMEPAGWRCCDPVTFTHCGYEWACTCVCVYVWCEAHSADRNPTLPPAFSAARRIQVHSCLQLMNKAAMEHRGGKFSDKVKDNPTAPSWSQNGATEEEYGCPDGPDEDKRVKRVLWAAKPAEEQPRLNFHIPRKSKEKRGALAPFVCLFFPLLTLKTPSLCIVVSSQPRQQLYASQARWMCCPVMLYIWAAQ